MVIRYRFRLYLLTLVVLAGFSGLLFRLWSIQISKHDEYRSKVPGTSDLTVRVPGTRGEIVDRNGVVLASNHASYEVIFNLKEIENEYRRQHENIPKHQYTVTMRGMPQKRTETDIIAILKDEDYVFDRLNELGLWKPYSADKLRVHYRSTRGVVPYTYRRDLTFEEFARFAEFNLDLPGVSVSARPTRYYPYDSLACHLLGYVKLPDIKMVSEEARREFSFYVGDDFGIHGLENIMDQYLQGTPGSRVPLKNEKGAIVGEIEDKYIPPSAGAEVVLTLDARIQHIAEEAMRVVGRGAAVVIDPRNGGIRAMVSVPSFNPNKFIPTIGMEDWNEYVSNPTHPLNNRAVQTFAPGSTYKIPAALSGCLAGIRNHSFHCAGGVTYGNKFMACWINERGGSHGGLGLGSAIMQSCNAFFYQWGNAAGINNIQTMGKLLGLGEMSGLDLTGESPGILPGPKWLRANQPGYRWSSAFTAMTAIGQGYCEASPLQMAMVTATVANGGLVYKPRLVEKAVASDGTVVFNNEPVLRHNLLKEGLTEKDMEIVRWGMFAVVNEGGGTARRARSDRTVISGKTGTAQAWRPDGQKDNNAWFIGFAPYQKPELAVCVMVQNGKSGGTVAAPIVKKIIEESMALEHGYERELLAVTEAGGNFDFNDYITFDPNADVSAAFGDDPGAGAVAASFAPPRPQGHLTVTYAAPSIQEKPDEEGSRQRSSEGGFFQKLFKKSGSSSGGSSQKKRGGFFDRFRSR